MSATLNTVGPSQILKLFKIMKIGEKAYISTVEVSRLISEMLIPNEPIKTRYPHPMKYKEDRRQSCDQKFNDCFLNFHKSPSRSEVVDLSP